MTDDVNFELKALYFQRKLGQLTPEKEARFQELLVESGILKSEKPE